MLVRSSLNPFSLANNLFIFNLLALTRKGILDIVLASWQTDCVFPYCHL